MARKVRTAAQIAASRSNGARSSGPATAAGKARSAANGRRHGLCSKEFTLEGAAEQAAFAKVQRELEFARGAVTEAQKACCHHLAVAIWRRRVCDHMEMALLQAIGRGEASADSGGDGLPGLRTLCRYRARIERDARAAEDSLASLQKGRREAMARQITMARELANPTHLPALRAQMGEDAFAAFREKLLAEIGPQNQALSARTNEPGQGGDGPADTGHRNR